MALPVAIGGLAAAADLARRAFRHNQIFCPSAEPVRTWDPADYGIPDGSAEERWIATPDGERLHAWYCRARKPMASALYCHGNTGNLTVSADDLPWLLEAGLSVLVFDYRGYGRSSGHPSVRGVVTDGLAAARLHDELRPPHLPSVLYGYSLGGAVAAQLIGRHPFDGLILQSTFTSLTRIARVAFPRAPMHLLAGGTFNTLGAVSRLDVPLLLLHGTDDEAVPCAMAHELYGACPSGKRIYAVDGGLHKDIFQRDPGGLVREISLFLGGLRCEPREAARPARRTGRLAERLRRLASR